MRRLAAVIGWPVAHSRSPALHNAAYAAMGVDAVYVALAVAPDRLAEAIAGVRALGMLGVNVTVPHKPGVLRLCDEISAEAEAVGAVNTVIPGEDGRLRGHNTDVEGFRAALLAAGPIPRRAVVLGAGGASRAVVAALGSLGVPSVVVARRGGDVAWAAGPLAEVCAGADLLVDATSVGLSADAEVQLPAPIPLELLAGDALVSSLVYHREPALLAAARARGLRTQGGAEMLILQAAAAFTLMTGVVAPVDAMRAAFAAG